MAKIYVTGVKVDGEHNDTVHITLTEPTEENGETIDLSIGEAFVAIPEGMPNPEVKATIIQAAQMIMNRHKEAQGKKAKLDKVDWPPIT